jgi:hypothetical protein
MGNACCCFPYFSSSFVLSEGVQVEIREIIVRLFCVGVKRGSFTLRKAHRQRVFENKVLKKKKTFGAKGA